MTFGELATGEHNAITDVAGVAVGHRTVWHDGDDRSADGMARTGVTAVLPDSIRAMFDAPPACGVAALNGAGELTGSWTAREWGVLETPILLTSTLAVGRAYDAVVGAVLDAVPEAATHVVIPMVGECDDSWLDDAGRRHVTVADARAAIDGAVTGPVAEGSVGAGTGMVTVGHKGGIGTSSRVLPQLGGTVGVLLLCNFGTAEQLRIAGRAVQQAQGSGPPPGGSCIGIVATDLTLDHHQLTRVARRVGLGLARVGSVGHHHSGEIFVAFSTTHRASRSGGAKPAPLGDEVLDDVFVAVADATEEAVLNALLVADTVVGRDGHIAPGLVLDPASYLAPT